MSALFDSANTVSFLGPILAMIALTFVGIATLMVRRGAAISRNEVDIEKYGTHKGLEEPNRVTSANRHMANLFEVPVLFYVICLASQLYGPGDSWQLGLAWVYFIARLGQSAIHLTYNNVNQRGMMWLAGNVVLVVMSIRLAIGML